jgi:putative protease
VKLLVPLSNSVDFLPLVEAGADEFYCGFVPHEWLRRYQNILPLNRREFMIMPSNLTSYTEMDIIGKMARDTGVSVKIAINYLYYLEEQYDLILEIVKKLIDKGLDTFIIADPALILFLKEKQVPCKIHLSGENGAYNALSMRFFLDLGVDRFVFSRKNTVDDIRSCIESIGRDSAEFEAFILNERCFFSGAFCNTFHCDELLNICSIPYKLGPKSNLTENNSNNYEFVGEKSAPAATDGFAADGCGICRLYDLIKAGVTHGKIVGRGKNFKDMLDDVRKVRKALTIAEKYKEKSPGLIREAFFPDACPEKSCYYIK